MKEPFFVGCHYCGESVDTTAGVNFRRVVGWERKGRYVGRAGGGSDISNRQVTDEYAHSWCVEKAKSGLSVGQGSLV